MAITGSFRLLALLPPFFAAGCDGRESGAVMVGTLERDRVEIVAEASEPIVAVEVREGQKVRAGDVLLRQETAAATARAAEADARVEEARQRLAELVNGTRPETIAAARADAASARALAVRNEAEYRRVQSVVARKLASESALDLARGARDSAREDQRAAEARLAEYVKGARAEDLDQARAALRAAEAARRELAVSDDRLIVRATRDGTVEALPFEAGERPPAGGPVAVLLADSPAYARIYVPESQRASVRAGQRATIHVDGRAEPLEGTFRYVAGQAAFTPYYALTQRDRSRLSFLAEVEVDGVAGPELPAGVPVEVTPVAAR